ncbi:MAG: hypothetical protein L3J41_10505 [Melioribacteraceae bacterium]|nr:hypothetical protein [Melioribacteraceae bacterium]
MISLYLRNNKIKMKQSQFKYLIIALSITAFSNVNSQTCGFGCLGLSGVFGGYSIQQYEADGLNHYLNSVILPSSSDAKFNFKEARGFKVGINLIRADYSNFFFTFKGYYQFLSEEQNIKIPLYSSADGPYTFYDAKLEMNNWGIGLDFGIPLFSFIDWKVVEGELKFFSPKLTQKIYNNDPLGNSISIENIYTPDKVQMGFSIGSGLIFNVIEDYVSLEATGMYTFIEITNLTSDHDGSSIPTKDSNTKFISNGGVQAFVQLNIGIPF